jgi:hypothetical protein
VVERGGRDLKGKSDACIQKLSRVESWASKEWGGAYFVFLFFSSQLWSRDLRVRL